MFLRTSLFGGSAMIRLHIWDDETVPDSVILDDGNPIILDYAHKIGFEVGDQIQYLTAIGTSVYFVIDVEPVWDGEREMRIVTIKPA
jgi:hypothetical protein